MQVSNLSNLSFKGTLTINFNKGSIDEHGKRPKEFRDEPHQVSISTKDRSKSLYFAPYFLSIYDYKTRVDTNIRYGDSSKFPLLLEAYNAAKGSDNVEVFVDLCC